MQYGPDPNAVYPNEAIKSVCFIKNIITRPNIIVGEYSYYDDMDGAEKFEDHVTHHYEFIGDKLIIGKFCAIAKGIEFVMNGANHRMCSVTTYPFNIMGGGWEQFTPALEDLPLKGDTVVGNDVWDWAECYCNAGCEYRRWCNYSRKFCRNKRHSRLLCRWWKSLQNNKKTL